jgi:copper homeostasis protein (lipoprotein)
MKTFSFTFLLLATLLIVSVMSCSTNQNQTESASELEVVTSRIPDMAHNSRNSLDWYGVYKGTTPCADCEGIETKITLKKDGTFKRSLKYLGRSDNSFQDEGNFEWNEEGSKVTLIGEDGLSQMFLVGENVLFHLDQEGNRITGDLAEMYKLAKNNVDPRLEDKKWLLIELRGKPFEKKEGQKNGSIEFNMETGMFAGNNTCNNFFGQYELKNGDRIQFGQAGTTLMACPDGEIERAFMEVLQMADNYSVVDGILSLNKAKMAPLARFELARD